jgi:hypothetical protein
VQVSQSTLNAGRQRWCFDPTVHKYSHYGRSDMPLVQFLESCQPKTCSKCGDATTAHVCTFLHGGQRLSLSVFSLGKPEKTVAESSVPSEVWVWVRVKEQPEVTRKHSRRIKLSTAAGCLSFAHFLELFVSMTSITITGVTLNRSVALYFKLKHFIVCLNPNVNRPFTMVIPTEPMDSNTHAYGLSIQQEAVSLLLVGSRQHHACCIYSTVWGLCCTRAAHPVVVGPGSAGLLYSIPACLLILLSVIQTAGPRSLSLFHVVLELDAQLSLMHIDRGKVRVVSTPVWRLVEAILLCHEQMPCFPDGTRDAVA